MDFFGVLALCFAGFVLILSPVVCLILLTFVLRRQNDAVRQMDNLQDGLFQLTRSLNKRSQFSPVPTPEEESPAEPEKAAESPALEVPEKTGEAKEMLPPVLPPVPPSVPCSISPVASAAVPEVVSQVEGPAMAVSGMPDKADSDASKPRHSGEFQEDELPLEAASASLVQRLWNWFVFGSDSLPENVSLEYAMATHWLLRIGILISVLCIGFFLKYSIDKNWIDDAGRCVLSVVVGLVMIGAGLKLKGKRFNLPGMGLLGAGLVVLYWSVYAAHVMYGLLPQVWALPAMIVITVCAGALAVRLRSPLVAIIGIIGGYGSPILMSLQQADVFAILVYMLILGLGVLGISFWRNWHLLNYLGFVFTYGITLSLQRQFTSGNFSRIFPILVLYFALYAAAMYSHNFVRGKKSTLIEMAGQVFNALLFFLLAGGLIKVLYAKEWTAVLSLGLALFFFIHALMLIRSSREDKGLEVTLIGLSAFFLTISMPIVLSNHWLSVAWALQALIMLWAAGKLKSGFLRSLAYGLYGITFLRIFFFDLHCEFNWFKPGGKQVYWQDLKERFLIFLIPVLSLFGGSWLQKKPVEEENEMPSSLGTQIFFWCGLLFAFLILNLEFNDLFLSLYIPGRAPGITALWVTLGAYLIWRTAKGNSQVSLPLLICLGMGLLFKTVFSDLPAWGFDSDSFICGGSHYDYIHASMRGLDFILILGVLFGAFRFLSAENEQSQIMKTVFGYMGIVVLFLYLTLELNTALTVFKEGFRAGAISILWSAFAISFLLTGLKKNLAPLRYIGLILFSVIVVKVFGSDLAQLDPLYRIIAFGILGIVVTAGSFGYLFFRQSIEQESPASKLDNTDVG